MDKISFWNKKILGWEDKNYKSANQSNFIESPVRARREFASEILLNQSSFKSVIDIGCGSGCLFEKLPDDRYESLLGVDFSDRAIEEAKKKFATKSHVSFEVDDVVNHSWENKDVIVGLGLLDWLQDSQLEIVAKKMKDKKFIFSFSEKRNSIHRYIHMIYVFFLYGWKTGGYIPRYYSEEKIQKLFGQHGDLYFFRDSRMAFGTLFTNFPLSME